MNTRTKRFSYFSKLENKEIIVRADTKTQAQAELAKLGYPVATKDIFNLTKLGM
jgi:hypothetical protein